MTDTSQGTSSTDSLRNAANEEAIRQVADAALFQASMPKDVPAIASAPPPPPSLPPPMFVPAHASKPAVSAHPSKPAFPPQSLSSSPPPPPVQARASESQLPTSRLPSLPSVFPPELERALAADSSPPSTLPAPPVQAVAPVAAEPRTVVMTRPRAAAMKASWRAIVSSVMHVAVRVPSRVSAVSAASRAAWTQKRVGIACGVLGITMIVGALVYGVFGLATARLDKPEVASLAVAVVLARAAIAVASMVVGYALLRMAERLAFPAAGLRLAPAPTVRPRV